MLNARKRLCKVKFSYVEERNDLGRKCHVKVSRSVDKQEKEDGNI